MQSFLDRDKPQKDFLKKKKKKKHVQILSESRSFMWDSWYLIKILLLYWRTSKLTWSPNCAGFCMLSELLYSDIYIYIYLYYPPSQEGFLFSSSFCFFFILSFLWIVSFFSARTIWAMKYNEHSLTERGRCQQLCVLDINQWFYQCISDKKHTQIMLNSILHEENEGDV